MQKGPALGERDLSVLRHLATHEGAPLQRSYPLPVKGQRAAIKNPAALSVTGLSLPSVAEGSDGGYIGVDG